MKNKKILSLAFGVACTLGVASLPTVFAESATSNTPKVYQTDIAKSVQERRNWNLLYYVKENYPVELVQKSLNEGADVNTRDVGEYTPLMWASGYGNVEIAKLLIKNGANVDAKDNKGCTALMVAAENNNIEIIIKFNPSVVLMLLEYTLKGKSDIYLKGR